MKPAVFKYVAPTTVEETLALLRVHGAEGKVLAGGQSLVPLINMRLARPSVLIDLNGVRALDYIREDGGEVAIGAMTRQRTAERSPVVAHVLPLLAAALPLVGHLQIRTRGTIGGSIAHADPSGELPAVLAALEGTVMVRGRRGTRRLRADAFFVSYLTTALRPDELLVEVRFPAHGQYGTAFLEVARRHGDYALVGVAAAVLMAGGRCTQARLALTGVGPTPVRIPDAEAAVTGQTLTDGVLAEVRKIVSDRVDPDSDIHASAAYRKDVAGVLAQRALRAAAGRAIKKTGPGTGDRGPGTTEMKKRVRTAKRTTPSLLTSKEITVRVNGIARTAGVDVRTTLVDFIREHVGLTGTHVGCEHGVCGACTILLDGAPVRSCLMFAVQAEGADVMTVEAMGTPEHLHPIQQAFREHHGLQCGFCTPGFLMTALALLRDNPHPADGEIREALAGNLCRCTGYQGIVEAVRDAAQRQKANRTDL